MSTKWRIQLCLKNTVQLLKNAVFRFRLIPKIDRYHALSDSTLLVAQCILYWLLWNTFAQSQVGVMLCPCWTHCIFIFPCSVVILTWQRQHRASSQGIFCALSCQKICISCNWFPLLLFLTGVNIPGWLLWFFDCTQSIQWDSFSKELVLVLHYWNEKLSTEAGVKQGAITT